MQNRSDITLVITALAFIRINNKTNLTRVLKLFVGIRSRVGIREPSYSTLQARNYILRDKRFGVQHIAMW